MKLKNSYNKKLLFIPGYWLIAILFLIMTIAPANISMAQESKKKASIRLNFTYKGITKYINAIVNEINNDSLDQPVEDMEVHFYVERMFSLLPIGGLFTWTDENGEVNIEFPGDLPGDTLGNVTIIVRIEDDEIYEDVEVSEIINWGVPLIIDQSYVKRTLMASRAPVFLMILIFSIIVVVWGYIIYIVYQVFRIRKISKNTT